MKKKFIFIAAVLLIVAGLFMLVRVAAETLMPKGRGALQITSNVKASVFLNNKPVGDAPICLCEQNQTIDAGEHDLKIVPQDQSLQPFSAKVRVNKGVLTAVERTFLPGALSSSYVLSLEEIKEKTPQIFIASIPEGTLVTIDGESKGVTPLLIDSISESEHEVEILKQGFAKKTIRVRAVPSHKLVLNIILGTDAGPDENLETSTVPSPSTTISPTEKSNEQNSVIINETPTGFLRVRSEPSTSASEVGRVNPGETYPILDENSSWFQIELEDGEKGWISNTYAEKTSDN